MSENEEFVREFLEESAENLDQLDQDLVALEKQPRDKSRLENIFRTIHTIKGTSGFFGFAKLGSLAHDGESLLGRVRDGELVLQQEIATALLNLVDSIREILANIQETGSEGSGDYRELSGRLIRLASTPGEAVPDDGDQDSKEPGNKESGNKESDSGKSNVSARDVAGHDETCGESTSPERVDRSPPMSTPIASPATEGSIRVDVGLLDRLMDLTGELVLARNRLNQFSAAADDRLLSGAIQQMSLITSGLQESVVQTRMQPVATIWGKLPRVIRDLAVTCGKQVQLEQEGEDTELDRSLLEAIKDPLTHLIRNSVDHGIEAPDIREDSGKPRVGRVSLRAYHEGGQVNIEVSDDGQGIDVTRVRQRAVDRGLIASDPSVTISEQELVRLIFEPGFSTARQVSDVSGRGVGMDVVKTNIERIGGAIELENRPGLGTTVRITIPLTLAILPAMIVKQGADRFAIPQLGVMELLHYRGETAEEVVEWVGDAPVCRLRGALLPLVYLDDVLCGKRRSSATRPSPEADLVLNIVVLQAEGHRLGLVVDRVLNIEEVVVKPLDSRLAAIGAFAGATIMGDGTVALILDLAGIARQSGISLEGITNSPAPELDDSPAMATYLLGELDDPRQDGARRIAIPLADVERLTELSIDQLESANCREVVQYGMGVMPVVRLAAILNVPLRERGRRTQETACLTVVVCRYRQQFAGLIISKILDIIDHPPLAELPRPGHGPIVSSCVIEGQVTDIIDPSAVFDLADMPWLEPTADPSDNVPEK